MIERIAAEYLLLLRDYLRGFTFALGVLSAIHLFVRYMPPIDSIGAQTMESIRGQR